MPWGFSVSPIRHIPNVDFSRIPDEYIGSWVLVRVCEDPAQQVVLASAATPEDLIAESHGKEWCDDPFIVMTKIGPVPSAARLAL